MKLSLKKNPIKIGSNPRIDWAVILLVMVVVGAIAVYGAVHLYLDIKSGEATVGAPATPETARVVNPAEISKLVESLDVRAREYSTIQKSSYTATYDPAR